MKRYFTLAIILIALVLTGRPLDVQAATEYSYPNNYLTLEVPDSTIVLTPATAQYDDAWAEAGISNPKGKLEEFENMGVTAAYYNPSSRTLVSFMVKHSAETSNLFSFNDMADDEVISYVSNQMGNPDNIELSVSIYPHSQAKFFRLELTVTEASSPATEILYGTLINGQMLQFDIYQNGRGTADEDFLRAIVDSVHFTKLLTHEEFLANAKSSFMKFMGVIGLIVLVFALLIFLTKQSQKRAKQRTARISDEMQSFRERKRAGLIDLTSPEVFTASCEYNTEAANLFSTFDTWLKNIFKTLTWVLVLGLVALVMLNNGSYIFGLVTAAVLVIILYVTYSAGEKRKETFKTQYAVKNKPVASYRFQNDCFVVSGIGSTTEYIYAQVTAIKTYNHYIYLYIGTEQALLIDADSTDQADRLISFIRGKMIN